MNPLLIALVISIAAGAFGSLWYRNEASEAVAAKETMRADLEGKVAKAERETRELETKYRAQEREWEVKYRKVEADGQATLEVVVAARDRAARTADRLQHATDLALNTLKRTGAPEAPTAAADCSAHEDAARVFADLFGRARTRARIVGSVADEAHARSQACERADAIDR